MARKKDSIRDGIGERWQKVREEEEERGSTETEKEKKKEQEPRERDKEGQVQVGLGVNVLCLYCLSEHWGGGRKEAVPAADMLYF